MMMWLFGRKGGALLNVLVLLAGTRHRMVANAAAATIELPSDNDETAASFQEKYRLTPNVSSTVKVTSDVPVTVSLYHENQYLMGQEPIVVGELHVFVRTNNCTNVTSPNVTVDDPQELSSIDIVSRDPTEVSSSSSSFVEPPASFFASWSYTWFWGCFEGQDSTCIVDDEKEEDGTDSESPSSAPSSSPLTPAPSSNPQPLKVETTGTTPSASFSFKPLRAIAILATILTALLVPGQGKLAILAAMIAVLLARHVGGTTSAAAATDSEGTQPETVFYSQSEHRRADELSSSSCTVNVELLLDNCFQPPLEVTAPLVRVQEGLQFVNLTTCIIYEEEELPDPDLRRCTTYYNATLAFPEQADVNTTSQGENDTLVVATIPTEDSYICYRAVEGRPFVDETGTPLQAKATESSTAVWSKIERAEDEEDDAVPALASLEDARVAADEWKARAAAEHASIASFCSVALTLLTNGAPPDLVRDSLLAALDEVRHAQVSFELASQLSLEHVEPGPLPPSSHRYEHNLAKLALDAAQEGCVDETLSALRMASEVDAMMMMMMSSSTDGAAGLATIGERMKSIASEEARHSVLAWRTVHWACRSDSDAREAVRDFFQGQQGATPGRLGTDKNVMAGWKEIYDRLVSLITMDMEEDTLSSTVAMGSVCVEEQPATLDERDALLKGEDRSFTERLVENIVHGVICAVGKSRQSAVQ